MFVLPNPDKIYSMNDIIRGEVLVHMDGKDIAKIQRLYNSPGQKKKIY